MVWEYINNFNKENDNILKITKNTEMKFIRCKKDPYDFKIRFYGQLEPNEQENIDSIIDDVEMIKQL